MKTMYNKFVNGMGQLRDIPLLFFRIILVIGFYQPAIMKIRNLSGVADWFASMNYPLPGVSAFLSMATEGLGIILILLGLGTRIIAVPLIFIMVIAILTVHISNGFPAGDNGFEIPLYYILMLFALMVFGPGKFSLDYLIGRRRKV